MKPVKLISCEGHRRWCSLEAKGPMSHSHPHEQASPCSGTGLELAPPREERSHAPFPGVTVILGTIHLEVSASGRGLYFEIIVVYLGGPVSFACATYLYPSSLELIWTLAWWKFSSVKADPGCFLNDEVMKG